MLSTLAACRQLGVTILPPTASIGNRRCPALPDDCSEKDLHEHPFRVNHGCCLLFVIIDNNTGQLTPRTHFKEHAVGGVADRQSGSSQDASNSRVGPAGQPLPPALASCCLRTRQCATRVHFQKTHCHCQLSAVALVLERLTACFETRS